MSTSQVFISYAWGGESEQVANQLENLFVQKGIELVRDKTDLGFKGLIKEFMQQIGKGNLVILIISDKYLKSKNCMFELMEVENKGDFFDRIFPIVLSDADIYDSLGILRYLKFWDQKIKDLNASAKELDNLADTRKVQEDINLYTDIRGAIDALAGKLSNMNTLTLEIMRTKNFQPLFDALGQKIVTPEAPLRPSKKEGKVLYHIPSMMKLQDWTRCTVRLAWEEIILTEGLKVPKEEQVIESIRLGNIMQVSLGESRSGGNFEIHSLTNEEQVIEEDDFTEWLFDVKALNPGKFSLILRISLIQMIEGKERKKDIVLEREVITEAEVPNALQMFETAESGLELAQQPKPGAIFAQLDKHLKTEHPLDSDAPAPPPIVDSFPPPAAPAPQPPSPPTITPMYKSVMPYAATVAGIILVGFIFLLQNNSSDLATSEEYTTVGNPPAIEEMPNPSVSEDRILIAMSLEGQTSTGENVSEMLIFGLEARQLDSLNSLDLGPYEMITLPVGDSLQVDIHSIKNFTIQEIKDSLQRLNTQPIRVGNQRILRKDLHLKRNF